jgi:hypothetical protein
MDDSLYDDPAVIRAGTAAFGLYARCGDYVARQLLDGVVPPEIAAQWGTPEWTGKLLAVGLWETVPGGFYMPRYLNEDKNPSREKVLADRQAKSDRQQRWLEKHRNGSSEQRRVSRRVNSASNGTSGDASKDAALPPSLTGRKGARARVPRGADARTPPALPVAAHSFKPDGRTDTCEACGLAEGHRVHTEES